MTHFYVSKRDWSFNLVPVRSLDRIWVTIVKKGKEQFQNTYQTIGPDFEDSSSLGYVYVLDAA